MSSVVVEEAVETPQEAQQFSEIDPPQDLAPQEDKPQESEEPTEYELPKKFQGKSMEDKRPKRTR